MKEEMTEEGGREGGKKERREGGKDSAQRKRFRGE